jgi:peptide-methionine (S)-S-oxide reductase
MMKLDKITLGGGCFWCLEALFNQLNGVEEVLSGYSGGAMINPNWEDVCSGLTGHAEVCEIQFDSTIIKLSALLEVFWEVHDPTTLNRQGYDIGSQYRSVVFCENEEQIQLALKSKEQATANFKSPIVTEIELRTNFYSAGSFHNSYFEVNKNQPYCQLVISPKLSKLKTQFPKILKK